jgi:hypothetical protein
MTGGRGVGLMSMPLSAFSGDASLPILNVANQNGSARGMRLVYSRRLNHVWSASAGYSFGRGQKLSANGLTDPTDFFSNGFFQTAAVQLAGDWSKAPCANRVSFLASGDGLCNRSIHGTTRGLIRRSADNAGSADVWSRCALSVIDARNLSIFKRAQ